MAEITPTKKPKQRSTSLYQICADWQTYAAKTVFEPPVHLSEVLLGAV